MVLPDRDFNNQLYKPLPSACVTLLRRVLSISTLLSCLPSFPFDQFASVWFGPQRCLPLLLYYFWFRWQLVEAKNWVAQWTSLHRYVLSFLLPLAGTYSQTHNLPHHTGSLNLSRLSSECAAEWTSLVVWHQSSQCLKPKLCARCRNTSSWSFAQSNLPYGSLWISQNALGIWRCVVTKDASRISIFQWLLRIPLNRRIAKVLWVQIHFRSGKQTLICKLEYPLGTLDRDFPLYREPP